MGKQIKLTRLMPKVGRDLLTTSGREFVERIGIEAVRDVAHAVLCGENLRDSTEMLTRRRISMSNGALIMMFLHGCSEIDNFINDLPSMASDEFLQTKKKDDRWILQWLLGLTNKAIQNVLRDDPDKLAKYQAEYKRTLTQVAESCESEFGCLTGNIEVSSETRTSINWSFMIHLLGAVGAQTLTLRGSEKATYGKLFERVILGSLLHILGFRLVDPETNTSLNKIFWLSTREEKRESDATLIYKAGKGVRFDIGFIGRGNPEISLDKTSRFEKEMEYGRSKHYMATFIIVDRIGADSRIVKLAEQIDGIIVQMSMAFWPREIARKLQDAVGLRHELIDMPTSEISEYLKIRITDVPIEDFIA